MNVRGRVLGISVGRSHLTVKVVNVNGAVDSKKQRWRQVGVGQIEQEGEERLA